MRNSICVLKLVVSRCGSISCGHQACIYFVIPSYALSKATLMNCIHSFTCACSPGLPHGAGEGGGVPQL